MGRAGIRMPEKRAVRLVETLEPICPPIWAYFRHLSGKEYFAANAEQVKEEVLFQVNYRTDLTTANMVRS